MLFLVETAVSVDAVSLGLIGLVSACLAGLFQILKSNKTERDAERIERAEERAVRKIEAIAREAETSAINAYRTTVAELIALIRDRVVS